jgi:hypothetical protein
MGHLVWGAILMIRVTRGTGNRDKGVWIILMGVRIFIVELKRVARTVECALIARSAPCGRGMHRKLQIDCLFACCIRRTAARCAMYAARCAWALRVARCATCLVSVALYCAMIHPTGQPCCAHLASVLTAQDRRAAHERHRRAHRGQPTSLDDACAPASASRARECSEACALQANGEIYRPELNLGG